MWSVARRPRWIAALLLAMLIAAGFAALGQWQLARSIDEGPTVDIETEQSVALATVAEPQMPLTVVAGGRIVTLEGSTVADDFSILTGRLQNGVEGYWVVAHVLVAGAQPEPSLAVAVGWAPTEEKAHSAIEELRGNDGVTEIRGRYVPSEAPQEDDFENGTRRTMSVPALINEWDEVPTGVYAGYVALADAPAGLEAIDAPPPSSEVSINWLNIFYAVEWAVFAGFAFFLWYRLVKDAWEREQEENAA